MILIKDILSYLDDEEITFDFTGNENTEIHGFSALNAYKKGTLTWVKKNHEISSHMLTLAITGRKNKLNATNIIRVEKSKAVFFMVLEHFFYNKKLALGVGENTVLSDGFTKGKNCCIGNNCSIIGNVTIGDNVSIGNNVTIYGDTYIGNNCTIESGTVVGTEGFGFYKDDDGNNIRVKHFGGVIIGDDVEVGANCVINKGTIGNTEIGDNVKIAALVRIPHNVQIGDRCMILGCIGGSCIIGEDSYIAPCSFVKNQVKVGCCCMVNVLTFLNSDLPDGHIADGARIVKYDYKRVINS